MPDKEEEVYSNPLPPSLQEEDEDDEFMSPQPLTNDDFRKLMMTPRVGQSGASSLQSPTSERIPLKKGEDDDAAAKRRKKKSYYAKLKKLEEDRQKELAEKYRDRARERRDGSNIDYEQTEIISTTADYRAVAPDAKSGENYAERRKQLIQESKYLGGDMEHTHLVKGLDYALLEKVRAEICSKELGDDLMEEAVNTKKEEEDPEVQMQFKTKIGRNIYRQLFRRQYPDRCELFLPGRTAYVVDLEDTFGDLDVPTTVIRSKADCPTLEATTTLTTNDIVINKLTQILSYLRQGKRDKKMKRKDKIKLREEDRPKLMEDGIYGEAGDYALSHSKAKEKERDHKEKDRRDRGKEHESDRSRDRDRKEYSRHQGRDYDRDRNYDKGRDRDRERNHDRDRKKSYFEKPVDEDDDRGVLNTKQSAKDFVQNITQKYGKEWNDMESSGGFSSVGVNDGMTEKKPPKEEERIKKLKSKMEIDSYAECYPGMMESADAIDDSDEEADYTKMDQGNKKGPVGRWDFDTQEEYSDYMSSKEALPKAAFQYGVKMADGRKTRRTGPKDEKKELDREWQKIQNIIAKRKNMGTEGGRYAKAAKNY